MDRAGGVGCAKVPAQLAHPAVADGHGLPAVPVEKLLG
jgi:hypothetical protein